MKGVGLREKEKENIKKNTINTIKIYNFFCLVTFKKNRNFFFF